MVKVPFRQALQQIEDRLKSTVDQKHHADIDKIFKDYKDTTPCAALYRMNFMANHNLLAELIEMSMFTREEYQ